MKFNITYFGPLKLYHLRRDFVLAMQYGLESLGHQVTCSMASVWPDAINLVIGGYFLDNNSIRQLIASKIRYINVNTEVITNNTLNFKQEKTDLVGGYIPLMQGGLAAWDVIQDNMHHYAKRNVSNGHFMRWGYVPELEEIRHAGDKDLDFYFFGMMQPRRAAIIDSLLKKGFRGVADSECPYFVRNSMIGRAKVQLNIIQATQYTHVNSFRICYLANNHCCILSEHENDPAGYLEAVEICTTEQIADRLADLAGGRYVESAEKLYETFRRRSMKDCMAELLEASLGATGNSQVTDNSKDKGA